MDNKEIAALARRHPAQYDTCPTCQTPNRCLTGELVDYIISLKIRNNKLRARMVEAQASLDQIKQQAYESIRKAAEQRRESDPQAGQ